MPSLPVLGLATLLAASCSVPGTVDADYVIVNGRVMDPETGLDGVRNVVIKEDRIVAVSEDETLGVGDQTRVIDAQGLVVAPGFVDILAHPRASLEPQEYKIKDGVTTVVSMHGGPVEIDEWYSRIEATGSLHNFGTTVGHPEIRRAAGIEDRYDPAPDAARPRMMEIAAQAIDDGAMGIGFGINYTPGASYEEVVDMFQVAADHDVPAHVHSRYKGSVFPETILQSMEEIIAAAAITGASTQMVHLASSAIGSMDEALRMVEGARANGIDVMVDLHPYEANSTSLESALYDPGWEERFGGASVDSIMLVDTGERLNDETFAYWRERGATIVTFFIPKEETVMCLTHPFAMVTSDGVIVDGKGHPRGAGTFAKVLGQFVREEGHLTLMEGLRKMTLMPAQRIESADPGMKDRGRIREGAFADITIFDPNTIIDRATYVNSAQFSEGVHYVFVNGKLVLEEGGFVEGVRPGRAIRRPPSN
jgi:N-acyl-D-aspartate/D-glutamate deacylase